jgi:hypothetical protein
MFPEELLAEIRADCFAVRWGEFLNVAVEPATDDLEIEQGIEGNFLCYQIAKLAFGPCRFQPYSSFADRNSVVSLVVTGCRRTGFPDVPHL